MRYTLLFILTFFSILTVAQEHQLNLWADGNIPNFQETDEVEEADPNREILWLTKVQTPSMDVYLPTQGIAGIVLKYRLPKSKSQIEPHKSPLLDAKRGREGGK